jgi:hypothetical protein
MRRSLFVGTSVFFVCVSIFAGTVQQRLLRDRSFKLYAVIFRITQAPSGSVTNVQLAGAHDVRWEHEHPGISRQAQIDIPKAYLAAATKKIRATRYSLLKHTGKPEESYVGFYYAPTLGDRLIVDVTEPE